MNTFELDQNYIANTYARFPVEIVSGKGSIATDSDGKEYIDLGTGIAVNTFGYCDEEWTAAVTEQLGHFQHTSNLYYSAPSARLAHELCLRTGMKKVFFCNSGAEANECAIKAARKYGTEKKGKDAYGILTLCNSFHGRTITTLSATGQDSFHQLFTPMTPGFVHAPANDLGAVERIAKEMPLAAIMFEVVQGEGGVNPLTSEFVAGLVKLAKEKDILLIADEVQCGNGRTGELYGYMNFGMTPDIVTTAKGLGGGLPIGACMLGEKVESIFAPGDNGSTFGANPAVCAGALNIISRLDAAMLEGVRERSKLIFDTLQGKKGIVSVTGMGLMIGVETERPASDVIAACREKGVLVIKAKNKVRLLPALNIPMEQLKTALGILLAAAQE
ncbi:MAG: aminotransferase class III-fold pyridoxal phosphate-dependent enzyme [Clostridia bacterium]|nr:aminotransferase class III-fold pyridoxal phosphate-dependent enzyme [Clostridia bacterium]